MDAHDACSLHDADDTRRARRLHALVDRKPQRRADEALAARAEEQRVLHPVDRQEFLLAAQDRQVAFRRLAEADARVEDQVVARYTGMVGNRDRAAEEVLHRLDDVALVRFSFLIVHDDNRQARLRRDLGHLA